MSRIRRRIVGCSASRRSLVSCHTRLRETAAPVESILPDDKSPSPTVCISAETSKAAGCSHCNQMDPRRQLRNCRRIRELSRASLRKGSVSIDSAYSASSVGVMLSTILCRSSSAQRRGSYSNDDSISGSRVTKKEFRISITPIKLIAPIDSGCNRTTADQMTKISQNPRNDIKPTAL